MKKNFIKKTISGLMALSLLLPSFANLAVSAEEPEKFEYTMFGRNGVEINVSSNLCMNGNVHTNKDAAITANNKNINGKVTTSADIEKRVKHVYVDRKIHETYFTDNYSLYEEEYVYSDTNIHINTPLYCYSNITLNGNVSLNSSLGTLMNINVTGEVKNANNSVVYSKYGNITIENDSTANVNGLIYAPLGTVTINSPNVTINGIIIADQVIINGSSVNINCNDNVARFIGTTSEYYDYSGLEYLPEEWLGDTDEDALFDIYEKVIDSDTFNPDTDGDSLPDGYEFLTLDTDPIEVDTDENGILDCDEDFDADNLINLGEYQYQTLPFTSDTDEDGLLDGDEVNYYGTIPTDADTDDDKLLDGEEGYNGCIYIEHGVYFDPLNPDTDGNGILDGDEVFGQTKVEEVETYDEAITEVTVDMDINGNIYRNLTIESMYNIDSMSTNVHALIGEPFNFESESNFESATISFKIDQSKLGNTYFDNLLILWYNEEDQIFEEMPTTHDIVNSTVSTTTTHFSQYMVVDSVEWYHNWNNSINELRKMWSSNTSYQKNLKTILLVDCSYQMSTVDPIDYNQIVINYNGIYAHNYYKISDSIDDDYNAAMVFKEYGKRDCIRAEICENIINNICNKDKALVMTFSNGVETNTGWSSNWDYLMNGGTARTSGIQKVNNDGKQSHLNTAIKTALSYTNNSKDDMYRIIVITHSNVGFSYELSSYDYTNVDLNIVNLGPGNIGSYLESIIVSTGGEVYNAVNADELTTQSGGIVSVPPQFIGEDSDGDTIPDIVEQYGLKPNGELIGTNLYEKDTDGDGIEDNIELNFTIDSIAYPLTKELIEIAVHPTSDPTKIDSDGDGILDAYDIDPLKVETDPLSPCNVESVEFINIPSDRYGQPDFIISLVKSEMYSDKIFFANAKGITNTGGFLVTNDLKDELDRLENGYQSHFLATWASTNEAAAHAAKQETDQLVPRYFDYGSTEYYGCWAYNYQAELSLLNYYAEIVDKALQAYMIYTSIVNIYQSRMLAVNQQSMSLSKSEYSATTKTVSNGSSNLNKYGIDVENLSFSKTVSGHINRPYQESKLLANEIMESATPIPDPQGTNALLWKVNGTFNGSVGYYELLVDPASNCVWHFVFKS